MKKNIGKELKKTKGITLIALIVTIIVLLILAAISLGAVFSDKGIFSRAETSALEHRAGTVEYEVTVWKNDKKMAKYEQSEVSNRDELIESQKARGLLTDEEAEKAKARGNVQIGTKIINYGSKITANTKVYPISFNNDENIDCAVITIDYGSYTLEEYIERVNALSDEEINQVLDKQFKAILENKDKFPEELISTIEEHLEKYDGTNIDEICEELLPREIFENDNSGIIDYKHYCAFGMDGETIIRYLGWSFILNRRMLHGYRY